MKLKYYLKLFKIPRMIFFLEVILGYIIANNLLINKQDFFVLLIVFVSFSLLVYLGIYTINDILDRKADRKNPEKRLRPIASGKISVKKGIVFLIIIILLGLFLGYLISVKLFIMELIFIFVNLVYSLYLKHIPYIEFFSNGITHGLRLYLGIILAGSYDFILLAVSFYLTSVIFSVLKRENEIRKKQIQSRKTLKKYKLKVLYLIYILISLFIILIAVYIQGLQRLVVLIEIITFMLILMSYHSSKYLQRKIDPILKF